MKILVKCSFEVVVDCPDNASYDPYFDIEENHCPCTGIVGAEFDKVYSQAKNDGVCWACSLNGKNEIINIIKDKGE